MYRLYLYKFLVDFWLIVPVIVPFYKSHGLSALQILTVQAAFSVSQLLFEVPAGYFADVVGRRRALIAAAIFMCCGVGLYAFSDAFVWFIVAEVILGIAGALRSGTDSAILYDLLKSEHDEHLYKRYEGRAEFWCRSGTAVSSIGGGLFGAFATLRLPFYVNIASSLLMVAVGLSLREPPRKERPSGNPLRNIFRVGIRAIADGPLFGVMVRNAIIFATGVTAIWGYFLLYRDYGLPLWSHGIFFAAMQLTCAFCARHAADIERAAGHDTTMVAVSGAGVLFIAVALCGTPWVLVPIVLLHAAIWGTSTPLLLDAMQLRTGSDVRATTLSVASMVGRVIAIAWGPVFGWIIDRYSTGWAFAAMGVVFFITPPLLQWAVRTAMRMAGSKASR